VSRLLFVAGLDPASEAVFRHLTGEWAEAQAGIERRGREGVAETRVCSLWTGPAPAVADRLSGSPVVVYAAGARSPGSPGSGRPPVDLADAETVLAAAAAAGCRLVLVSSTEVYAPHHHHPGLVAEERAGAPAGAAGAAWLALEEAAARIAGAAGVPLTVLRAAPVPVPGGQDPWSRLLARPLVPTVAGFDPSLQLLAPEDLARVVAVAAASATSGTFNVVPDGTVPVHRAVRLAGGRRLPVPFGGRKRLRYPWTAGGERARAELGFVAAVSSAEVAARFSGTPPHPDPLPRDRGRGHLPPPCGVEALKEVDRSGSRGVDPGWEWGREGLDPFGMDRGYVERWGRRLFRFLHDRYWRIEVRGLEHVPRSGRGVLTGVHRGFMPFDGVMALHLLARECGRYPRFLLHPTLTKLPFLADFMTKLGGVLACQENADWVLERDGLLGIFPEGIRGAFTPYRRAYRLGKFGRDEYVRMALRNRAPILPFVTVGSAEIFPVVARLDWGWWKRLTEWPCFPIAPPFPLLPVPLPSKWHTRFLEPLHVEELHGPEAADDPEVVRAISRTVRARMEAAIAEMLARRRSVFFGSVFEERDARLPGAGARREEAL
jgi:1-acyl-sn-glycerol-3-phosphate acyltransferase/nucleoside-diphosphate-sugar epimerase